MIIHPKMFDKHLILCYNAEVFADVAELADAPDLGSGAHGVQVQVLSSAPLWVFLKDLSSNRTLFLFVNLLFYIKETLIF